MQQKEIYRIKKGQLIRNGLEITIDFGLVYDNEGLIYIDFYVDEKFDLNQFGRITYQEKIEFFTAFCVTDEGLNLEIKRLDFKSIIPHKNLVQMVCYDCLIVTKTKLVISIISTGDDALRLHYLTLEGLEMIYCNFTEHGRTIGQSNVGPFQMNLDYTSCDWNVDDIVYRMDYYKDYSHGKVIVKPDAKISTISYDRFLELKKDYLSYLSLINGARVRIRRECYGGLPEVVDGNPQGQTTVIYSFKSVLHLRHNEYIPVNHHLNIPINLLNKFMSQNFEKFRDWNRKIDLTSIIYYLNGAVQTRSLNEQFFILIIAFERLTALYAEQKGDNEVFHPTKENFTPIKDELFAVLEKYKADFGEHYLRAKGIIGGLSQVRRHSTREKMYGILNDLKIDITDDLERLIEAVRNDAVHKGNIGEDEEQQYRNAFLLNELIHEIILRLIEYLGPRMSTVIFGQTIMTIDTPINQIVVKDRTGQAHTNNI
ncbi:hypothetical protein D3C87_39390 [compost metagenome]